jgi:hypothetical protein
MTELDAHTWYRIALADALEMGATYPAAMAFAQAQIFAMFGNDGLTAVTDGQAWFAWIERMETQRHALMERTTA